MEHGSSDIYTIDRDRSLLNVPPAYTKYEMPPSYNDAVRLSSVSTVSPVADLSVANCTDGNNSTTEQNPIHESRLI